MLKLPHEETAIHIVGRTCCRHGPWMSKQGNKLCNVVGVAQGADWHCLDHRRKFIGWKQLANRIEIEWSRRYRVYGDPVRRKIAREDFGQGDDPALCRGIVRAGSGPTFCPASEAMLMIRP